MKAAWTAAEKIWNDHLVAEIDSETSLLHLDRIFLHERSGPFALRGLQEKGKAIRHPELVFGTMDHVIDTTPGRSDATKFKGGTDFIRAFRDGTRHSGITIFDIDDPRQGIVHVVSPEQGIALPGCTFFCPDSHTCTLGGIGALAWGGGATETQHALATQTLVAKRRKQMRIRFDGSLQPHVVAKDLILALIGRHGAGGGSGYIVEFAGSAIRSLSVEARMTICNMAVEFGASTGIIAPDSATIEWFAGRPYAPKGALWDKAAKYWQNLAGDDEARFDEEITIDAASIAPHVTWGTSPQHVVPIDAVVPEASSAGDATDRGGIEKALAYMNLAPGQRMEGLPIDAAFVGSCTNSRLADLREAAQILDGRKVSPHVKAICVPGSSQVKRAAEAEGLDRIFRSAGFEWRESGCSLCFFAGGDSFGGARRVISSTNRNFEGRQGPGVQTHLASPLTVAASAVAGAIADPRKLGI